MPPFATPHLPRNLRGHPLLTSKSRMLPSALHGGVLSGDGAREWPGLRLGHSRGEGREGGVVSVVLRAYQGMFLRGPAPGVANVVSLGRAGKGVELVF